MLLIALCKLTFYSKIIMLTKATKVLYTTSCIRNLVMAIVEKLLVFGSCRTQFSCHCVCSQWSRLLQGFEIKNECMDQKVASDIFTRYRIAFAPARKSYRIGFLFTHKNGDYGAASVMERSRSTLVSKVMSHTSDSFSCWHKKPSGIVWT